MSKISKCDINNLLTLFEDVLSPAEILSSKLMAQVSTAFTRERLKLRLTQSEFAKYIGVTQSQISRWEHGDYSFSLEKIADIASKLNLDVNIYAVDMSIYKSLSGYSSDYISSPQPFSFVYKDVQTANKNRIYNKDKLQPIFSNIKEDISYVAVR